nr:hypothetical protein CFP56_09827 [Quercus suber]
MRWPVINPTMGKSPLSGLCHKYLLSVSSCSRILSCRCFLQHQVTESSAQSTKKSINELLNRGQNPVDDHVKVLDQLAQNLGKRLERSKNSL